MLIDLTYFIGEVSISQITQEAVGETVTAYIAKYEPLLLQDVLGYAFYQYVKDHPTEQRIKDILDGKDFTGKDGIPSTWSGLANNTTKHSPIAGFVFYWYVRNKFEVQTGIATVKAKAENAIVIAPEYTLIKAYNDMVDQVNQLHRFLEANASIYPEYVPRETKCYGEDEKLNHFGI